jgi:hypothetical protein
VRNWLDSATIKHLSYALVYWALTWASVSLATDRWDWKYLAAGALSILIPAFQRLSQPDLVAPIDALNKRNPTP